MVEVRIAARGEVVNGEVAWPFKRWVVRFHETTVTDGRPDQRDLTFLVHSPSRDLGVMGGAGQRGVLHRYPGRGYWFVPFLERALKGNGRFSQRSPNGAELISESPRSSPADEALEDEIADVVGRAIGGDALRDPGHVFDEIDEIQIEIILD